MQLKKKNHFVVANAVHLKKKKKKINHGKLKKSFWVHHGATLFMLLLFFFTVFHVCLLCSILSCKILNNSFRRHLNLWQFAWWSFPLIRNHFSNPKCLTCYHFFPLLKVIKEELWTNHELLKQASSGNRKEKEKKNNQKQKENHNRERQTRKDKFPYSEERTKRHADVFSSLSFPGDRYVRALKALAV